VANLVNQLHLALLNSIAAETLAGLDLALGLELILVSPHGSSTRDVSVGSLLDLAIGCRSLLERGIERGHGVNGRLFGDLGIVIVDPGCLAVTLGRGSTALGGALLVVLLLRLWGRRPCHG
jgi:hypothetical protein